MSTTGGSVNAAAAARPQQPATAAASTFSDTKTEVSVSSSIGWAGDYCKKMMALNWDYTCGPLRVVQVGPHNHHWQRLHAPGHAVLPRADGTLQHFKETHKHETDAELMKQVLLSGVSKPRRDPKEKLHETRRQPTEVNLDVLKTRLQAQSVPLPPARPTISVYDPKSRMPPQYDDASSIFSCSTTAMIRPTGGLIGTGRTGVSSGTAALQSSRLIFGGTGNFGVTSGAAAAIAAAAVKGRGGGENNDNAGVRSSSSSCASSSVVSQSRQQQTQQQEQSPAAATSQQNHRPASRQEEAKKALEAVRSENNSVKSELARARQTLDTIEKVIEEHESSKRRSSNNNSNSADGVAPAVAAPVATADDTSNNKQQRKDAAATIESIQRQQRHEHSKNKAAAVAHSQERKQRKAAKQQQKQLKLVESKDVVADQEAKGVSAAAGATVGTLDFDAMTKSSTMNVRRQLSHQLEVSRRALTPWC